MGNVRWLCTAVNLPYFVSAVQSKTIMVRLVFEDCWKEHSQWKSHSAQQPAISNQAYLVKYKKANTHCESLLRTGVNVPHYSYSCHTAQESLAVQCVVASQRRVETCSSSSLWQPVSQPFHGNSALVHPAVGMEPIDAGFESGLGRAFIKLVILAWRQTSVCFTPSFCKTWYRHQAEAVTHPCPSLAKWLTSNMILQ